MTHKPVKQTETENVVPFRPMNMLEEVERMFENLVPQGWRRSLRTEHSLLHENLPLIDVIEQDESIMVRAALPGVDKDNLEVSTTQFTLTIRGTTHKESKEEQGEYYRREISSGTFLRTVTLPAAIDEANIKAVFKNGMLEVTLPKLESARRHSIPIQTD